MCGLASKHRRMHYTEGLGCPLPGVLADAEELFPIGGALRKEAPRGHVSDQGALGVLVFLDASGIGGW